MVQHDQHDHIPRCKTGVVQHDHIPRCKTGVVQHDHIPRCSVVFCPLPDLTESLEAPHHASSMETLRHLAIIQHHNKQQQTTTNLTTNTTYDSNKLFEEIQKLFETFPLYP